jgi:hypothetical protein
MYIPFYIKVASMAFPVSKYEDGSNVSKGQIIRLNLRDGEKQPFGQQLIGSSDGFDWIWRHLGCNYWKVTSQTVESPWSCQ